MKIQLVTKPLSEISSDVIVIPVFEGVHEVTKLEVAQSFLKANPKFGKELQNQLILSKDKYILLLGMGKKEKFNFEKLQNWAGAAVKNSKDKKGITLFMPDTDQISSEKMGEAVALGIEIGAYDPSKNYKSSYEEPKLINVEILVERADRAYQEGLKKGITIAEGINLARTLGDMPPNQMTPTYFLGIAQKVAKDNKLKITFLDEKKAKKIGMGAFTGVAQGSDEPSFMIAIEYKGDYRSKDVYGLVGKGITFDTGGISIKPSSSMHEMKYDMAGAADVLAAIMVASKLGLKTNIVAVMAVTENLPGGRAQRPGDIVKTYSGKTAEIIDTDAEGRLVLIDAVSYAQKDFKANKIIDLATLTGAIIVALGDNIAGAFGNDSVFTQKLVEIGKVVGEKIWEMPMDEEFEEMIKSDLADIANLGRGGSHRSAAGSSTGAKFIEAGIEKGNKWIHLDIAGVAWDMKKKSFRAIGATGWGIKTLVELVSS